jgi:YD repeat-containing protein
MREMFPISVHRRGARCGVRYGTALTLSIVAAAGCSGSDPRTSRTEAAITSTPWVSADEAPVLLSLTYGRVRGSLDYEVDFALGSLPAIGQAPGLELGVRVRSSGGAGACGPGCELLLSSASADGAAWNVGEAGGGRRRFEPSGAGLREVAVEPGVPLRAATAQASGGQLVITEVGGRLVRRFDSAGREVARETPWGNLALSYDAAGRLVSASNAAGQTLAVAYDGGGRLSQVTDPTGFAMHLVYGYDGHVVSLEGPADGAVTPSLQLGWMGSNLSSVARVGFGPVQLGYSNGKVSSVNDQDGGAYALRATATSVQVQDSSGQRTTLTVAAGAIAAVESSSGDQTTYVRDAQGRVTAIQQATGAAPRTTTFTYDGQHRLTSATDADGNREQWTYDSEGRVLAQVDARGRSTTFAYDSAGNLTSVADPLGRVASYAYNARGEQLSSSAGGITTSATYNARGQLATLTDAFGVVTSYSYDPLGRVTSVARPGEPTVSITRASSAAGEQITTTVGSESSTVTADFYQRITAVSTSSGAQASYSYDPVTGLPAQATSSFRGAVSTRQQSYTNTGDTNQLWINGRQRQSSARVVPPGSAWFDDVLPGDGSGSGSGMGSGSGSGSGAGSGSGSASLPTGPL